MCGGEVPTPIIVDLRDTGKPFELCSQCVHDVREFINVRAIRIYKTNAAANKEITLKKPKK